MTKSHFMIEVTDTLDFIEFKFSVLQYAVKRIKRENKWV